ncbi:ATP-binding protein, partial [Candidatus Latescibacterota bacterium]
MAVDGIDKLIKIPFEGGAPEQLTFHQGDHWDPKCSPDGKWILYIVRPDRVLWVYNNEKKESMRVFPDLELRHWSGCFSPDGKKICYVLFPDSTLTSELYVADFPFEKAAQTKKNKYGVKIVSKGFNKWYTGWSPDGKWITYSQAGDIWIVPAEGGDPVNLTAPFKKRERIGYVVIDVSFENLNKAVAESTRTAIFITIILIGFGALSAVILVRNVVQPVQNIADATTKVAQGDFNQTVSVTRSDEIGILAESFNTMTGQLQKYREEIETLNRELETKVRERTAELENKHNELDKAYGDLEKAYKELETLDKAKDDFLSLVSHELRTPLGSMLLHAGMLLNKLVDSDEKQTEYHANIVEDCKRLTRLVNDVLDLSKIEAGRMPFIFEALPVRELLSDINSSLRPEFEKKGLHFDYETVSDEIFLLGDRDKIIEVLTNIISNAIKFTPDGGSITVSLATDNNTGTLAIKDTGTGIAKENIPKVFDRFSQLENIEHHSEGTGLGMTIAKSIIDHHGGSIRIESEPGKGTTVFFSLPLAQKPPEPLQSTHGEVLSNSKKPITSLREPETARLLIVDDEKSYRQALADCVQSAGFESLEASDGNEALHMVNTHKPALIILDVMMRGLSGLDVCRKIRDDPETRDIKVIILSARGQEKEKEEGFEAGADRYMTKPFDYKELIRTIEELLD